ncbi:hypothetical protein J9303_15125 [Bacillaceae bacterium Marseille-Q3522]|nr:hypothetical protein [Bacillaceae bacterium Marseille-Q3522]
MFRRRRNNRGFFWASMLGLGVGAAALGLTRTRNRNMMEQVQHLVNQFLSRNTNRMPANTAVTEFAKEIAPDKDPFTNQ